MKNLILKIRDNANKERSHLEKQKWVEIVSMGKTLVALNNHLTGIYCPLSTLNSNWFGCYA